jgi:Yip1 domain
MTSPEPIRPLKDVWLRPRRVFRELSQQPIGITDYLLTAAQGVGYYLTLYRTQTVEPHMSAWDIIGNSLRLGPIVGVASAFFFSIIYGRLGNRVGGKGTRNQAFHVLAYGGVPVVAALGLWVLAALIAGDAAFVNTPDAEVDGFVSVILHLQFASYILLLLWSVVLQVMGFSEIQGLLTRKAFAVWVLGQLIGALAAFFLAVVLAILFPSIVADLPH